MIRFFDIFFSALGLLFFSPLFILISILIKIESTGPVFYKQVRVGKGEKPFFLIKFRSMYIGSEKKGLITIGNRDPRVTRVGNFIRKFKIDELPQLLNVLMGEMSIVGPRPEVPKYVSLYNDEQREILTVKPGISDYASIKYRNENDLLSTVENPEDYYISVLIPAKIDLNKIYVQNRNICSYFKIIIKTVFSVFDHL